MRETAAKDGRHRLLDLPVARARVLIEERLGREDHSVQTKPALGRLLVDERLLDWMRVLDSAQAFERHDLGAVHCRDRRDARSQSLPADDRRARPALAEAAAELRTVQSELVAENVEER